VRRLRFTRAHALILPLVLSTGCSGCGGCDEAEPPPAPAVAAVTPPPAEPPPVETTTVAAIDDEAMKAALLGLNQQPELAPEPQPEPVRRRRQVYVDNEPEEPAVPPTLTDQGFYSALDRWGGVKRCLARNPTIKARGKAAISVRFVVDKEGSVLESEIIAKNTDEAEQIAPCVERESRRVRFPEFTEDKPVTKDAKFVF
jgi:hypothetical protein